MIMAVGWWTMTIIAAEVRKLPTLQQQQLLPQQEERRAPTTMRIIAMRRAAMTIKKKWMAVPNMTPVWLQPYGIRRPTNSAAARSTNTNPLGGIMKSITNNHSSVNSTASTMMTTPVEKATASFHSNVNRYTTPNSTSFRSSINDYNDYYYKGESSMNVRVSNRLFSSVLCCWEYRDNPSSLQSTTLTLMNRVG